jgi:hypothetical protein
VILSPIVINIFVDMLAFLIAREKEDDQVGRLVPHIVDGGKSVLQRDLAKAVHMKLILLNNYPF